jgi:excisionase family DNA binding protein
MHPNEYAKLALKGVQLLTVAETCRRLGCSRSTFYLLLRSNDLAALKIRNSTRVREDALEAYIAGLPLSHTTDVEA